MGGDAKVRRRLLVTYPMVLLCYLSPVSMYSADSIGHKELQAHGNRLTLHQEMAHKATIRQMALSTTAAIH